MRFVATASLLLASVAAGAQEATQVDRGQALVERMCAECHAVGAAGDSRHPGAPPFRRLERVVDFETFVDRLREGLIAPHPDMPEFRFTRQDARAIAAYVMSIQGEGGR
jgi:cytochrome c